MSDPQQSSGQLKYRIYYNFGRSAEMMPWMYDEAQKARLKTLPSGSAELQLKEEVTNDESSFFPANGFYSKGRRFAGWRVRVRSDRQWFWILEDGTYALKSTYDAKTMTPIRRFRDRERIPYLSLPQIDRMVAEAIWEEGPADSYMLIYHSGTKSPELAWNFDETYGEIERLQTGSAEYRLREPVVNGAAFYQTNDDTAGCQPDAPANDDGNFRAQNMNSSAAENRLAAPAAEQSLRQAETFSEKPHQAAPVGNEGSARLIKNGFLYPGHVFAGWRLRLKCRGKWYWLLDDLSVKPKAAYDKRLDRSIRLLQEGDALPFFAEPGLTTIVAEAVWKKV